MQIQILGAESLGVRGLSCVVKTGDRNIVLDPGLALGYQRNGLLPHPIQVAAGERVREDIITALRDATDLVISHFHGDHIPLPDANPYQLKAAQVVNLLQPVRLWTKGTDDEADRMRQRADCLRDILQRDLPNAQGQKAGPFTFSTAMPHGEKGSALGTVMMTHIEDDDDVFVHASDIQLLSDEAVLQISRWKATVLLVSGPPLYHHLSAHDQKTAWSHANTLAAQVKTCIIDHHLLRCEEGITWLDRLSARTGHKVLCAADFMKRPRRFLEARRSELYEAAPVPAGWHEAYSHGLADTLAFREKE